uniref:RUN domain-containing protein n=1 Tax=Dracunculus medinensis TaxID=318479 RepID=A0A0N4U9I6_DRAME
LNNSLLSLSTHFAQVQFRLKQISQADSCDKDKLLKDLQEFAFRGCTDVEEVKRKIGNNFGLGKEGVNRQKERQMELITQLKRQLEELEKFAYETGEGGLPSSEIIARQKVVIDKLHEKMQLNLELDKMSQSDLQKQVDEALKQLINPIKAKEKLVEQLQTQIVDLERFVSFLQGETADRTPTSFSSTRTKPVKKNIFMNLIGCGNNRFERNELKNTIQGNHYGLVPKHYNKLIIFLFNFLDERARLELAVDSTVQVLEKYLLLSVEHERREIIPPNYLDEVFERSEQEVVSVIRKVFCPALRSLLEHGMNSATVRLSNPFISFGCLPSRKVSQKLNHIWDVILFYYDSKWGRELSDAPVRQLSQSFQLDEIGGRSITSKQILLTTIENIVATHSKLKRTPDAMWKAFVSAALNEKKLPAWIRIIFRTRQVIQQCYSSWAYVARTGCEDCYILLESLHKYNFILPVDLAVRPFHQMKDAF